MGTFGTIILLIIAFFLICGAITNFIAAAARAAVPKTGKTTKVRSGEIHWVENGQGRPIVMIHGLGANLRNFTYALTGKLDDEFRVIALDRAGCGWSTRDGIAQSTLPEQARMIAEFLKKEGIEKPVLVGHSLGGAVSLSLALDHPEQVGALALLAPLTQSGAEPPEVFKPLMVANGFLRWLVAQTISTPRGIMRAKESLAAVFAPEPAPADFALRAGGVLGLRPKGFVAPSEDFVAVPASIDAVAARLPQLTVGGGVLYGVEDKILDAEVHGRGLANAAPAIELELIEGAGHMLPMTQVDACVAFIRGVAGRAS